MGINRRTEDILITIFCVGMVIMLGWVIAMPKDTVVEDAEVVVNEDTTVVDEDTTVVDEDQMHCLALNIYHEARGDNFAGQVAVADVTMNRVESSRYPNTICEVVREAKLSEWWLEQGKEVPVRHQCQFSWYCDGIDDTPTNTDSFNRSILIAYDVIENNMHRGITEGATHYHAGYVTPAWRDDRGMKLIGKIGDHIFYRFD